MSSTTMHFGPEWMRTKHQPLSRSQPPPSPPPSNLINNSGASTYSALVSATPTASSEASDDAHPFRYSKDELLRIYQEGGKGGLGLEVERWEGVVREAGAEPIALREMSEAEKKLFAGPLNSELRRRPSQSMDFLSPLNTSTLERPRLTHSTSATANSPLRDRFGALKRRDSGATGSSDTTSLSLPRKPSLSALQAPALSPRDVSPRTRVGYTPSFDGVLNNGESWIARRRISESSLKAAAAASGRDAANTQSSKASGIREEKEDDQGLAARSHSGDNQNAFASSSPHSHTEDSVKYDAVGGGLENLNGISQPNSFIANGAPNPNFFAANHMDAGPPPGLIDLAAVEWTYKDPTGQIQGPFRADLMQKWYNDGYFSSDLPMKRVVYDTLWSTVEELTQRANGENIFMSPLLSSLPPSRGNGSPLQTYPSSDNLFNEPYQPAPIRTLRTSTLESYLTGGSLPSDSPSSSIGASHFGNPSPDPGAFGGRDVKTYFGNDHLVSRLPAYGMQEHISAYGDRQPLGHEHPNNGINLQQGPSFTNFVPDRDPNFSGYGYTPAQVSHDPWMMRSNMPSSMYAAGREHIGRTENTHHDSVPRTFNGALYTNDNLGGFNGQITRLNEGHHGYSHYDYPDQPAFQNIAQDQAQMASPARDFAEHISQSNPLAGFRNLSLDSVPPKSPQNDNAGLPSVPVQSPWKVLPEISTPHIPDATGPTSQSPWNTEPSSLPTSDRKDPVASIPLVNGDASRQNDVPTSSTKPIPESAVVVDIPNKVTSPVDRKVHSRDPLESTPTSESSAPQASQHTSKTPANVSIPSSTPQVSPTESPVVSPAPKTAWAKEEEGKKKKGPVPSISLREIQEAEAKKLESRKTAEREKEKLARVSALAENKEDIQPYTTSWGLPTSQAGSRGSAPVREVATPSAQSPATTPVWTTPLKQPAVKKTMKEIQEEEESRKKMAMKEVTTPVVAKRGYAETTTKVAAPSPAATTTNNVWTTVGPSGKTATPAVPSPVRSVAQAATVAPTSSAAALSRAPISSAMKTRPVVTKAEDMSDNPSHEFLKWTSDSLKGLNNSVNVEEIISMLLSFPLDPDATTMEIISDTIYSNSTTLDGRRFASEFVAKRKADARSKASSASGKAKPVSIADVVKATPKATQQEWGFKVVNKKKKGGRA